MTNTVLARSIAFAAFLFISIITSAQCNIENFTVTISDCQAGNTVDVIVDFDTSTPSPIGYQVVTTTGFSVVQIDEFPYSLTLDGNCVTDYTVGVVDLSVADCEVNENIGVICCDIICELQAEVNSLQCTENQNIIASIDINLSGSLADSVDIFTNDDYISTTALTELGAVELPSLGPVQNLVVCEQGTMCCDTLDISDPCFCNIFDIHLAVTDCDAPMNSYFLRVDFETTSPSSDSFNLGRPGNALGTHAYADLPVRVGPISFDEDDNDIFILDQVDALCFGFIPHITLDSCGAISCELSDLEVTSTIDCADSGEETFTLSFDTSVESDGFLINIDGLSFGPFPYGQGEYTVGPLPSDGVSSSLVEVVDLADADCTISTMVSPMLCDCNFENISVTQFCNEDVLISALIDFDVDGAVSDSFDLIGGNGTTRYAYSDLPINVFGLPNENISLMIVDAINTNCSLLIDQPLECVLECEITNFEVEVLSCADLGIANIAFRFDSDDFGTPEFGLSYNGTLLGFYTLQDTGDYILPLQEIDCELDFNTFTVTAIDDDSCFAEFAMPNIDCCTPCTIDSTEIEVTCLDNFQISVFLDFGYDGEATDMFDLFFDEELFGTFSYDQIPLNVNLPSANQGEISYLIEFENCSIQDTFAYDCTEECIVENIQLDTLGCDNGMFTASLNFDHSESNDSFLLMVNDITGGTYALDDLPIDIGPYVADGETEYTFTISVIDEESCIGIFELGAIDCGPNAIDDYILPQIKWSTLPNGILLEGIASFKQMTLIDLNGRTIQQNKITNDQLFIENRDRIHGLYFVRLQDEEGYIYTRKVVL